MATNLPAQYDAARKALSTAVSYFDIKKVRSVAMAMETLAHQARDPELASHAVHLKVDATCKLGIRIIEDKAAGKLAKGKQTAKGFKKNPLGSPTLAEQQVDKNLA